MNELELRICEVDPDFRWSWVSSLRGHRFISHRDERTFVTLGDGALPESGPAPLLNVKTHRLRGTYDWDRVAQTPLLELRFYRVFPGKRAQFAQFFRTKCLGPLTEYGMTVAGQFDSLDDDNVFLWFRGFPDMVARDQRKHAFYTSVLWLKELESEAFSMIEDYRNVVLVAPVVE
jgi:hypothetical protein